MASANRRMVSSSLTPGTKTQSAPASTYRLARPMVSANGSPVVPRESTRRCGHSGRRCRRARRLVRRRADRRPPPRRTACPGPASSRSQLRHSDLRGSRHGAGDVVGGVAVPGLEIRGDGHSHCRDHVSQPAPASSRGPASSPSGTPHRPRDAGAGRGDGGEPDLLEDAGGSGIPRVGDGTKPPGARCRSRKVVDLMIRRRSTGRVVSR